MLSNLLKAVLVFSMAFPAQLFAYSESNGSVRASQLNLEINPSDVANDIREAMYLEDPMLEEFVTSEDFPREMYRPFSGDRKLLDRDPYFMRASRVG